MKVATDSFECAKTPTDRKEMVNSVMYCSEQISVPETFPNILKDYAKAAIRTQPYDLLRWSAAYFRCLAQNEPPPAKCRLEKDAICGSITRGYLRVLLDQVGKGFFISREILQKKWEGLCLPQDELLGYLSLCRMLNWPQVHWLKVLAVMVGSLNETPTGTMKMLCELLTDDLEGGPARIPMWMFRTVYTFVAELDCSDEQIFVNGRKKLGEDEFEPETTMDNVPKVFSTTSFKQQIMNECLQRYNEEYQVDAKRSIFEILNEEKRTEPVQGAASSTSLTSSVSSGFQFAGKPGDTKQVIQKGGDFDSLILLLKEAQGAKLHEYEGPHHISQVNIEHAKRREAKVEAEREAHALRQAESNKKYLHLESVNMVREVGPPWSWIHQFVSNNCAAVSYNFIEEDSIASDKTPPESSDESFDFSREKPISADDTESETHFFSTTTDNVEDLVKDEKANLNAADTKKEEKLVLQNMRDTLLKAESDGDIDVRDTSSIISFVNKDEMGVLLRGGERAAPTFSVEILDQILRSAMDGGTVFENIDDVMLYVRQKYKQLTTDTQMRYFVESGFYQTLKAEDKFVGEEEAEGEDEGEEEEEGVSEEESKVRKRSVKTASNAPSKRSEESHSESELTQDTVDKPTVVKVKGKSESSDDDQEEDDIKTIKTNDTAKTETTKEKADLKLDTFAEVIPVSSEPIDIEAVGQMENVFESCGVEMDPKILAKKISDTMILGLADKDLKSEMGEEEEVASTIESTQNAESRGGYATDVSSNELTTLTTFDRDVELPEFVCGVDAAMKNAAEKRPEYECVVPSYPGIGKSVSKKTIQDFLTYLKFRSRSQKGMVSPANFMEDKCPKMFD